MKTIAIAVMLMLVGLVSCVPNATKSSCSDSYVWCKKVPPRYCNYGLLKKICPKSCGACPAPPKCKDLSHVCKKSSLQDCVGNPELVAKCPRTCRACPCKDTTPNCSKVPIIRCSETRIRKKCPERCGDCCFSIHGFSVFC